MVHNTELETSWLAVDTHREARREEEKERRRKIPHSKMVNFYATQRWLTSMESRRTFVRKGVV